MSLSSLGKKYIMGISGQLFCIFLVFHLAGNLALFAGPETFNSYAAKLYSLGMLLYIAEIGLLAILVFHLVTAIVLTFQNLAARPVRYAVDNSSGEKRLLSTTMILSGIVILTFITVHVIQFRFGDRPIVDGQASLYHLVQDTFSNPAWVGFYVICVGVLSAHLSHGFQSAFRSLGLTSPKYTPIIVSVGWVYAIGVGVGYILLPLYMHFGTGG